MKTRIIITGSIPSERQQNFINMIKELLIPPKETTILQSDTPWMKITHYVKIEQSVNSDNELDIERTHILEVNCEVDKK